MESKSDYKVYRMINIDEATIASCNEAFICFDTQEDRAFYALLKLHGKQSIDRRRYLKTSNPGNGNIQRIAIKKSVSRSVFSVYLQKVVAYFVSTIYNSAKRGL